MAEFITVKKEDPEIGIYEFSKEVSLRKKELFKINIFASVRYILYINGEYICEGPCRGPRDVYYFDTVSTELKEGVNNICVAVMYVKKQFNTVFKFDKPLLIFKGDSENHTVISDNSWECRYRTGHRLFTQEGWRYSLAPNEEFFANSSLKSVDVEKADCYEYNFTKGEKIPWGLSVENPYLQLRPIPMIYPCEEFELKVVKRGENFIELDAGEYVSAKVKVNIGAECDAKIIYSECYAFSEGQKKRRRDDMNGELDGMYDVIHSGNDTFSFETFWFRAFRFIRIETKSPEKIIKVTAKRCHYPLDITSTFECSDEYYNKMHRISINTMLCCMHEIFVDCPHYELQQYQMDTAIEANISMRMSNDVRLIKKVIDDLAASQISSGLLLANYPSVNTQIIPGFALFWVFLLRDYLDYTKDCEFVYNYLGVMDKLLNYFDNEIRKQGYIGTSDFWDFVDWVKEWGDDGVPENESNDIFTIYNMYYLCALKDAAYICRRLNKDFYAQEYMNRYNMLKQTVNELCFDGKLYTDGHKNKNHSEHTIIWSILADMVSDDKAKEMIGHMNDEGMRKIAVSMHYYLFRAFEKCGMYHLVVDKYVAWKRMIDYNCTTWCETYPEVTRSECHGWSSVPLYEFMTNILGVKCGFDDEIVIKPEILDLYYAKGTVPTRFGNVYVEWEKSENEFSIKILAPENIRKVLIMPNGREIIFDDAEYVKKIGLEG